MYRRYDPFGLAVDFSIPVVQKTSSDDLCQETHLVLNLYNSEVDSTLPADWTYTSDTNDEDKDDDITTFLAGVSGYAEIEIPVSYLEHNVTYTFTATYLEQEYDLTLSNLKVLEDV